MGISGGRGLVGDVSLSKLLMNLIRCLGVVVKVTTGSYF